MSTTNKGLNRVSSSNQTNEMMLGDRYSSRKSDNSSFKSIESETSTTSKKTKFGGFLSSLKIKASSRVHSAKISSSSSAMSPESKIDIELENLINQQQNSVNTNWAVDLKRKDSIEEVFVQDTEVQVAERLSMNNKKSNENLKKQSVILDKCSMYSFESNSTKNNTQENNDTKYSLYWSKIDPNSGLKIPNVRAHSTIAIGDYIYVFGGCDEKSNFNDLYVFDSDMMIWSKPAVQGDAPPALRAHTAIAYNKNVYIFGGATTDGYSNDVYEFNISTYRWKRLNCKGDVPSPRRAHVACTYADSMFVFGGGGDNVAFNNCYELNLKVQPPTWNLVQSKGIKPSARGYHSGNLHMNQWIICGGTSGDSKDKGVLILDLETKEWKRVTTPDYFNRFAHTSTLIGNQLYIIGGSNQQSFDNDVLVYDIKKQTVEKKITNGIQIPNIGYHSAVLVDYRLYIIGGFDDKSFLDDVFVLDLGSSSYLSL